MLIFVSFLVNRILAKSCNPDATAFGAFFGCLVANGVYRVDQAGELAAETAVVEKLEGFKVDYGKWQKLTEISIGLGQND